MHESLRLFKDLKQFERYPNGVVQVPCQIMGTSFFPGGVGLWVDQLSNLPDFPIRGVMILGHDFDSESGYKSSREVGRENMQMPTWRNLLELLCECGIDKKDCFFTNTYMGLRQGAKNTGRFPGESDLEFKRKCQSFLLDQLSMQKPELIVAMGGSVLDFLAPLAPQLNDWANGGSFNTRDRQNISLKKGVKFEKCQAPATVVVSIVHPSMRKSNVHRRRWQTFIGNRAEQELVKEAKRLSRLK